MRRLAAARVAVLLLLGPAAAACGGAGVADPCAGRTGIAGTHEIAIESGGVERRFRVTAPESALRGEPVPLVLVYHGVGGSAAGIDALTGFPDKAAAEGFVTAAGDGIGHSWNAGACCNPAAAEDVDDVGFTRDMVAAIEAEYCIDPSRVYATGFSNGAAMAFRLACEASDLFAAFAPVAGALALPGCAPAAPRPIDVVNNVSDPVVPFRLGEASFAAFLDRNRCGESRRVEQPAANATCEIAPDCADGATTALCAVSGLSHQWPGGATNPAGPFRATDSVWQFFAGAAL